MVRLRRQRHTEPVKNQTARRRQQARADSVFFRQRLITIRFKHLQTTRNRRRVFRLPRRSGKYASVPRFVNPKIISVRIKLRGKSKEGGCSPLLGRFKGIAKGQGSHANPAKRFVWEKEEQRNGRRLSAASGGQDKGCGVCSDANPPLPSFLSTVNGAFFPMRERKRG